MTAPGPRDPQAEQDGAAFTGWMEARGCNPDLTMVCSNFGPVDMREAFTAGVQYARDLDAATLAAEVHAGHVRIETGPPAALRALRGLLGVQQPQPAPGHVLVMRGTIALRDAEIELLNARVAELAEALTEAAGHVEPLDQNSELAVGRWLDLAGRARAAQAAPGLRLALESQVRLWRHHAEEDPDDDSYDSTTRATVRQCANDLATILARHPERPAPEPVGTEKP